MTDLEFIEQQIECFKNNIKFFEDLLKRRENPLIPRKEDDSKFDLLTINDLKIKIKDNYEMLNYCNKIKEDLEAWEVVKEENFNLRQKLNAEEECNVILENKIKEFKEIIVILNEKFFIDLIERKNDYKLGFQPKTPIVNGIETRFTQLDKDKAEIFKKALEVDDERS